MDYHGSGQIGHHTAFTRRLLTLRQLPGAAASLSVFVERRVACQLPTPCEEIGWPPGWTSQLPTRAVGRSVSCRLKVDGCITKNRVIKDQEKR